MSKKKFSPFVGTLDFVGKSKKNFSILNIPSGSKETIPSNQQMIVDGVMTIDGMLEINGMLDFIHNNEDAGLPPYYVANGETYRIPSGRQMFSAVQLQIDGFLKVDGLLILGS